MAAQPNIRAIDDLEALAEAILTNSKLIKGFFTENHIPTPSFDVNAPLGFPEAPPNIKEARTTLLDASRKIHQLVASPVDHLIWLSGSYNDNAALRWVTTYGIPSAIPLEGDMSYADVAAKTNTDEGLTRRYLRFLTTHNIFREPRPGFVAHTAESKLLTIPGPMDMITYASVDCLRMAANHIEAVEKYGVSEEMNETAFNVASGSDLPVFRAWNEDPIKGPRFARAMTALQATPAYALPHLLAGFDWAGLPPNSTIVDIGGSVGQCSKAIAAIAPNPKFIVQDLETTIKDATSTPLPADLESRISYQVHDFFTPEPVAGADVYLLRMILHDYPDKYALEILRNIVPAMKPGHSRLLIVDSLLPPVGMLSNNDERMLRFMDIQMLIMLNAKEREMSEWGQLFAQASDGKLKIANVKMPEGSALAAMEVILEE